MESLSNTNVLPLCTDYLKNIGLPESELSDFNARHFRTCLVMKLASVCVIPKNRSEKTKGNQTHIHVTGKSREFFFDKAIIDSGISKDEKIDIQVSMANIKSLNKLDMSTCTTLEWHSTKTCLKYSATHQSQVQVSKIRKDGPEFIQLRNGLYEDDLLIFLKDEKQALYAVGIPKAFYGTKYTVPDGMFTNLESKDAISIKTVLSDIENSIDTNTLISDDSDLVDTLYQQLVNGIEDYEDNSTINYDNEDYLGNPNGKNLHSNRPSTDPMIGKRAIKANNYKCIFSSDDDHHETFIKENGEPYMEAHHIIPLVMQKSFKKKLDTIGNIVPVCPCCHRKLHHGKKEEIALMLEQLYSKRGEVLEKSGLHITANQLRSFYGCKKRADTKNASSTPVQICLEASDAVSILSSSIDDTVEYIIDGSPMNLTTNCVFVRKLDRYVRLGMDEENTCYIFYFESDNIEDGYDDYEENTF